MAGNKSLAVIKAKAEARPEHRNDGTLSQTEVSVNVIRNRIIDLTLEPGSKIDERLLMDRFGLGRTPAREALNRLSSEGFVKIQRNKGAYVAPLGLAHVRQFFDAYFAAERMSGYFCDTRHEGLSADLASIQADHEKASQSGDRLRITEANTRFHARIALASNNEHVYDFCARLHQQARRLSHVVYNFETLSDGEREGIRRKIQGHHRAIMEAIAEGDNAELVAQLTLHAQLFHDRIMRVLREVRGQDLVFVHPKPAP